MAGCFADDVGPDDVIIENRLDLLVVGFSSRGIAGTADEPEFLACECDEDDGLPKMVLAHYAGEFEYNCRAAGIVIGAGRGRFCGFVTGRAQIDGIVVSGPR